MARDVDPFSYFFDHASAISGLGGERRSPDPQYCFHTHYLDVPPGAASYELRLRGVRASQGELTVRVHAYKPSTGGNASLVAGSRLYVAVEDRQDLSIQVKFVALRDVHYAFYGYFSEYSDIAADCLEVSLHEPESDEPAYIEPPVSINYKGIGAREVRPANALIHAGKFSIQAPVSQDFTKDQRAEIARADDKAQLAAWYEAIIINALAAYNIGGAGQDVLVIGALPPTIRATLSQFGYILHEVSGSRASCDGGYFADIIFWMEDIPHNSDAGKRWTLIQSWLAHLKIGGLAVIVLHYKVEDELLGKQAFDQSDVSRNEIGQWALRLIGMGYSVAPLAFAPLADLVLTQDGRTTFSFIVQRQ